MCLQFFKNNQFINNPYAKEAYVGVVYAAPLQDERCRIRLEICGPDRKLKKAFQFSREEGAGRKELCQAII